MNDEEIPTYTPSDQLQAIGEAQTHLTSRRRGELGPKLGKIEDKIIALISTSVHGKNYYSKPTWMCCGLWLRGGQAGVLAVS